MVCHTETTSFRLWSLLCTDVTMHSAPKCSTVEGQEPITFHKEDAASHLPIGKNPTPPELSRNTGASRDILLTSQFADERRLARHIEEVAQNTTLCVGILCTQHGSHRIRRKSAVYRLMERTSQYLMGRDGLSNHPDTKNVPVTKGHLPGGVHAGNPYVSNDKLLDIACISERISA